MTDTLTKVWETGETITADNLNQITPLNVLVSPATDDPSDESLVTDLSAKEIFDAVISGRYVVLTYSDMETNSSFYLIVSITKDAGDDYVNYTMYTAYSTGLTVDMMTWNSESDDDPFAYTAIPK